MTEPLRVPLRFVHPRRCLNRVPLRAGELRRVRAPANPPTTLLGYDLGCLGCGFWSAWSVVDEQPAIEEGPVVEDAALVDDEESSAPVRFWRPAWVRSARRVPCLRCRRVLVLEGETFAAYPAEAGP